MAGFRQEAQGIEDIYINEWQFDFTFRGVWSNGWWSEGSGDIHVGTTQDTQGTVALTTFTPEPGPIALLSSGIVLGWRSWKRRNACSRSAAPFRLMN